MRVSILNFLLLFAATAPSAAAYIVNNPEGSKNSKPSKPTDLTTSDEAIVPGWFNPLDGDRMIDDDVYNDDSNNNKKGCGGSYMNSLRVSSETNPPTNGASQPPVVVGGSSCGGSHMNSLGALKVVDNNNNHNNHNNHKNGAKAAVPKTLDNVCGGTYMNSVGTLASKDNVNHNSDRNNDDFEASTPTTNNKGCGGTYMNSVGTLASELPNFSTNVPLYQEWITPDNLQEDRVVRQTVTTLRDRYNRQYERSLEKQQQLLNQQNQKHQGRSGGFSVTKRNGKPQQNGTVQRRNGKHQQQPSPVVPKPLYPDQSKIWPTPDEQDM